MDEVSGPYYVSIGANPSAVMLFASMACDEFAAYGLSVGIGPSYSQLDNTACVLLMMDGNRKFRSIYPFAIMRQISQMLSGIRAFLMDNDPATIPLHKMRRPRSYPAFTTAILFIGGVAIELVGGIILSRRSDLGSAAGEAHNPDYATLR